MITRTSVSVSTHTIRKMRPSRSGIALKRRSAPDGSGAVQSGWRAAVSGQGYVALAGDVLGVTR